MPKYVLFVHGYSETSLAAYFEFPNILQAAMPEIQDVGLAAFDSLDDGITISDLASAMEVRVASLESTRQWTMADTALICHSTGALIARRWILNRVENGGVLPSHLVTMAGANHGSTLAAMGKTPLGYLQKLILRHEWSVGQGVLTDLEYGSKFLLELNSDWLDAWNNAKLGNMLAFSMGGDTTGAAADPTLRVFWETQERGSDNTVRISGANLNYTIIDAKHDENGTAVTCRSPERAIPHRILPGFSHYGPTTGILGNVHASTDLPMACVLEALRVNTNDALAYASLEAGWRIENDAWITNNAQDANSTLLFALTDRSDSQISDCMISIMDQATMGTDPTTVDLTPANASTIATAMNNASKSVLPHSPMQNDVQKGSYAFYLNFSDYVSSSPHWYSIEISGASGMGRYDYPYPILLFTQPPSMTHTIAVNECTYVRLTVGKNSNSAYGVYEVAAVPPPDQQVFPPLPAPNRIA